MTDIIEEIARAIYHGRARNKPWEALQVEFQRQYHKQARAAYAVARRHVLEEAAKVAEECALIDHKPELSPGSELNAFMDGQDAASHQIATAIRALGEDR